ncbi:MAG: hypothetical protein OSB70_06565 [Myxococcota bacterium]|nr:hypothetical protein [Myxococcota bacterium]
MLSQLRWILGMAIGVVIMAAVWREPYVRDPSGEPARPRPAIARSAEPAAPSPSVRWQLRLEAYWAELDASLADPLNAGADHRVIQEILRAQHFELDERPTVRVLDASREG